MLTIETIMRSGINKQMYKFLILGMAWIFLFAGTWGQRGDVMVAEAPVVASHDVMITQNQLRAMNEALLMMGVVQYQFEGYSDEQLRADRFIYHVEIVPFDHEYQDCLGYTWRRYVFTPLAKSMLNPEWAADLYSWITNRADRYRLPFAEVTEAYRCFCRGEEIPLVMKGEDQTIAEYTNFADFYGDFMNKHHYCITAANWAVYKAIYDQCPHMRTIYENSFSDPKTVQAFDTLTGGRWLGFLLDIDFIVEVR